MWVLTTPAPNANSILSYAYRWHQCCQTKEAGTSVRRRFWAALRQAMCLTVLVGRALLGELSMCVRGQFSTDQSTAPAFVRFWTNNGQRSAQRPRGLSAYDPKRTLIVDFINWPGPAGSSGPRESARPRKRGRHTRSKRPHARTGLNL
jgi:hypothetical protein